LACLLAFASALIVDSAASAQTVWSGLSYTFTKGSGADPLVATNQDRITSNVWITRNSFGQGLLNARSECGGTECGFIHNLSPAGTAWATAGMLANSDESIAASNWQNLVFTNWETALGGQSNVGHNILTPTYRDAVVHLLEDNIYLDLRFLAWSQQGAGSFSYIRATASAPPEPTGDYNANGVVDAADYVAWRNTSGQTGVTPGTGADGNSSGTIDPGDYDYWRARFGNAAGSGSLAATGSAIPEPTAVLLLIAGTIAHCLRRHER
jgi:hypothetical protein